MENGKWKISSYSNFSLFTFLFFTRSYLKNTFCFAALRLCGKFSRFPAKRQSSQRKKRSFCRIIIFEMACNK